MQFKTAYENQQGIIDRRRAMAQARLQRVSELLAEPVTDTTQENLTKATYDLQLAINSVTTAMTTGSVEAMIACAELSRFGDIDRWRSAIKHLLSNQFGLLNRVDVGAFLSIALEAERQAKELSLEFWQGFPLLERELRPLLLDVRTVLHRYAQMRQSPEEETKLFHGLGLLVDVQTLLDKHVDRRDARLEVLGEVTAFFTE